MTTATMTTAHDVNEFCAWLKRTYGYGNVRLLPGGRWGATYSFPSSDDIMVGTLGKRSGYDARWAFATPNEAAEALRTWNGAPDTEPAGFMRRVPGRRRSRPWRRALDERRQA